MARSGRCLRLGLWYTARSRQRDASLRPPADEGPALRSSASTTCVVLLLRQALKAGREPEGRPGDAELQQHLTHAGHVFSRRPPMRREAAARLDVRRWDST